MFSERQLIMRIVLGKLESSARHLSEKGFESVYYTHQYQMLREMMAVSKFVVTQYDTVPYHIATK